MSLLPVSPYTAPTPVLFGHYWRNWDEREVSDRAACVDHSAVLGGPLTACRWIRGEKTGASTTARSSPAVNVLNVHRGSIERIQLATARHRSPGHA